MKCYEVLHTLVLLDGDPFPDQTIRARMFANIRALPPFALQAFLVDPYQAGEPLASACPAFSNAPFFASRGAEFWDLHHSSLDLYPDQVAGRLPPATPCAPWFTGLEVSIVIEVYGCH